MADLRLSLQGRRFAKGRPTGRYSVDVDQEYLQPLARAATGAFRDAARGIQAEGRAAIIAGGLGSRFARQFRVFAFPRRQFSLSPALRGWHARGWAHSRIGRYANIFARGGTIRGRPLLWIPLPTAPKVTGGRRLTPAIFEHEIGPLISMRRTRRPILAAQSLRPGNGRQLTASSLKTGARNAASRRAGGKGRRTYLVPIFVGVSAAHIDKRVDIDGIFARWNARLPELYADRLSRTT